jgi:hypothetical protein
MYMSENVSMIYHTERYFASVSVLFCLSQCNIIHTKHLLTGVLFLLKAFPEELDAHNMIANGEIEAPGFGCCNPNACPSCYF